MVSSFDAERVRIERGPAVVGDARRTGGDTTAIRRATGWIPQVGLEEGLTEQYRWASASVLGSGSAAGR